MEALYLFASIACGFLNWQLLRVLYHRRCALAGIIMIVLTVTATVATERLATSMERALDKIRQTERITSAWSR